MVLSKKDHIKTRDFYRDMLQQFSPEDPKAMGWVSEESQKTRFHLLTLTGDFFERSILDVGCGVGDYFGYLEEVDYKYDYTGIDFVEESVKAAQEKYSEGKFINQDLFNVKEKYDYVVANGSFNYLVNNNEELMRKAIEKMFDTCNIGVGITMLSSYAPDEYKDSSMHYFSPEEIFSFCKKLTPWVTIRHDYLPHDFTVHLYK